MLGAMYLQYTHAFSKPENHLRSTQVSPRYMRKVIAIKYSYVSIV